MNSGIAWPLYGHDAAELSFISALESRRLHHGWLIEGPSGIGKSLLARRIAARLLGAQSAGSSLDASLVDSTVQKVLADSHPDLKWLARRPDEKGKIKQDIPVDDVRALNAFFSLKAGLGGWRVGVIDSLDELNRSGGNALLKTLEEPPKDCLLILISHGTRPILPTIRSRCRTLRLSPLSEEETSRVFDTIDLDADTARMAATLARGRPGHGIRLSTPTGLSAANAVRNYLRALPRPSDALLADLIAKGSSDKDAFDAVCDEVLSWLEKRSETVPALSARWLKMSQTLSTARELNMDMAQTLSKLVTGLQSVAKTG